MGKQVEGYEHSGRLSRKALHARDGGVDALSERVEVLAPVGTAYNYLPVQHIAPRRKGELGEVAAECLAVARLQKHLLAIHERDAAKAVELDLVDIVIP